MGLRKLRCERPLSLLRPAKTQTPPGHSVGHGDAHAQPAADDEAGTCQSILS